MTTNNPYNIYRGPNSLKDYYNPSCQPYIPLVELPPKLNPFYDDGVRIYAKMMTCLPANNVKSIPALNMLSDPSITPDTKTIVEFSSGSTIISLSILSRVLHDIDDVRAYLSNKTSTTKINLLRFFGLGLTLFPGPAQPSPTNPEGGIYAASHLNTSSSSSSSVHNPNQYSTPLNPLSHTLHTAPQILQQLPEITLVCSGLGTTGTLTGIGTYLKKHKGEGEVRVVGVCTKEGQRVPGPRAKGLLDGIDFGEDTKGGIDGYCLDWEKVVDEVVEVGENEAYRKSMELSREGIVCGPSSGLAFNGLGEYLWRLKHTTREGLDAVRGKDGLVHAVFLACDLPYGYLQEYIDKLQDSPQKNSRNSNEESLFRDIVNESLLETDLYPHSTTWILSPESANKLLYTAVISPNSTSFTFGLPQNSLSQIETPPTTPPLLNQNTLLLDFRPASDFQRWHLPHAVSLPLQCLSSLASGRYEDINPFMPPHRKGGLMDTVWSEFETLFNPSKSEVAKKRVGSWRKEGVEVVVYCGTKGSAVGRLGVSVLRKFGVIGWVYSSIAGDEGRMIK